LQGGAPPPLSGPRGRARARPPPLVAPLLLIPLKIVQS